MATAAEISEYDIDELEIRLSETRRELFNLRFQLATGQLDNFSRLQHVRKDIARMLTELRSREIAEAEGLVVDELPAHRAAAKLRSEDAALGRTRTTAAERRAAARLEAGPSGADAETVDAETVDVETVDAETVDAETVDAEAVDVEESATAGSDGADTAEANEEES